MYKPCPIHWSFFLKSVFLQRSSSKSLQSCFSNSDVSEKKFQLKAKCIEFDRVKTDLFCLHNIRISSAPMHPPAQYYRLLGHVVHQERAVKSACCKAYNQTLIRCPYSQHRQLCLRKNPRTPISTFRISESHLCIEMLQLDRLPVLCK